MKISTIRTKTTNILLNHQRTTAERSQEGNEDNDGYSDVHIQPASANHQYSEDEYNEDQEDQNSLEHPRTIYAVNFDVDLFPPKCHKTSTYHGRVIKNLILTERLIKRVWNTCTNLRFVPDGREPAFLYESMHG